MAAATLAVISPIPRRTPTWTALHRQMARSLVPWVLRHPITEMEMFTADLRMLRPRIAPQADQKARMAECIPMAVPTTNNTDRLPMAATNRLKNWADRLLFGITLPDATPASRTRHTIPNRALVLPRIFKTFSHFSVHKDTQPLELEAHNCRNQARTTCQKKKDHISSTNKHRMSSFQISNRLHFS